MIREVTAIVVLLALAGCAGARLALPHPDYSERVNLARLLGGDVEPSRNVRPDLRLAVVEKVDLHVLPAAGRVCSRTFNNPDECYARLNKRTIAVEIEDEGINASVGGNYDLTILGGLIREAGSDDELAFVMAHEYAHAMFGHVARSVNNSLWAGLIGGLAGLATAAAVGADQYTATDVTMRSATIGQIIGATAFSKEMELEADHLALFIVDDAGYDMDKGMEFFKRTLQLQAHYYNTGQERVVGFFQTHPSDEERLLRLLATKEIIERGADRPVWNP